MTLLDLFQSLDCVSITVDFLYSYTGRKNIYIVFVLITRHDSKIKLIHLAGVSPSKIEYGLKTTLKLRQTL